MNVEEVIEKAKKLIEIPKEEYEKSNLAIKEVIEKLQEEKEKLGIDALIELHGSFAHDTWLKEDKDIDIFIFSKEGKEKAIENGLKIAKKAFPNHIERYAEHPFITVSHKGYEFDIVPAVLINEGEKIQTAVDRTRLHTRYLSKVLNDELRNEIRLLKKFAKTLDIYGAEIKFGGFSGYLCELLIINYGSFLNLVKNAINWIPYKTILGGEWKLEPAELVVVDPVDKKRNVAAAFKKMNIFKLGCNMFLNRPSLDFFLGRKYSYDINASLKAFEQRGTKAYAIIFDYPKIPPDVFWGEIERARRNFVNFLINNEFDVIDSISFSDEKRFASIFIEISQENLPSLKNLIGPPLNEVKNLRKFLDSHESDVLYVKENRVFSYALRKIKNLEEAYKIWLKSESLPKDLVKPLLNSKLLEVNENIDKELRKAVSDLAFKSLWWLRKELIKKFEIKIEESS